MKEEDLRRYEKGVKILGLRGALLEELKEIKKGIGFFVIIRDREQQNIHNCDRGDVCLKKDQLKVVSDTIARLLEEEINELQKEFEAL